MDLLRFQSFVCNDDMNKKAEWIFLLGVISIGGLLRFWNVTYVPPSLSHDEVAISYNAYSILKTGKDEYGAPFPVLFRSFDDYKLPGMVYTTIPSIALFGLNELGVRVPSAFLGTLSVFLFYFLAKELAKDQRKALVISFFFAISIWHINFSRQLFESNGSLFFLIAGVYFLLRSTKKPIFLLWASICFVASLYFYYSVRLIIPFILLAFAIVNRRFVIKRYKLALVAFCIGLATLLPLGKEMFSKGGFARIAIVSIVNDPVYEARRREFAKIIAYNNDFLHKLLYNRRVVLGISMGENYLKNLSPSHIFVNGTTSAGLLFPLEAPFFFLGIYLLLTHKNPHKWLFIAWTLATPLVGAFTTDQPNALRTLPNAPMFSLFSGLGFWGIIQFLRKKRAKTVFLAIFVVLLMYSFRNFFVSYFYAFPQKNSRSFGDGYKQMINYLSQYEYKYNRIYVSGEYWRPYIFTLFWKRYEPSLYQKSGSRNHFSRYHFGRAMWDHSEPGIYFAQKETDFSTFPNAEDALFILTPVDYKIHSDQFNQIGSINGVFAKDVFIPAVLR